MTPFEWLAVAYFLVLLTASHHASTRRGVTSVFGAIALVVVATFALPWTARAWLPHAYLVLGYWIPAAFVRGPNEMFEAWLRRTDERTVGNWSARGAVLELAYLSCYPLVPAAFTIVFASGSAEDVTWFWVAVLGSGYACYVSLPWSAARPPRLLDSGRPARPHALASMNELVLGRVSHQLVTFPSGHVAVSLAAAMGVWRVSPQAGAVFGAVSLLIAVAAVAGRYHYAVDVLLGLVVGAAVPLLTRFIV